MAGVSSDDRLQQYFDGELASEDAAELREMLESDEALQAKLEGLSHLRALMVEGAEERGEEIDSDALWSGIAARLGEESAQDDDPLLPSDDAEPATAEAARPKLGVVQGGKTNEAVAKPARSNVVWIGVAASLAVAAAVLLFVLRPFDLGTTTPSPPLAAAPPPPGSEVVEVDFGYNTGAIFSVEGQEGEHYAVVWISDEKPSLEDEGVERIQ